MRGICINCEVHWIWVDNGEKLCDCICPTCKMHLLHPKQIKNSDLLPHYSTDCLKVTCQEEDAFDIYVRSNEFKIRRELSNEQRKKEICRILREEFIIDKAKQILIRKLKRKVDGL